MSGRPGQTCARCRFIYTGPELQAGHGACRRYPPQGYPLASFPRVTLIGWCGEFRDPLKTPEQLVAEAAA